MLTIYSDRRWPAETGIGKVQSELEARMPADMRIVDLEVAGKIGSPLSPIAISRRLFGKSGGSVFFNAGFVPPAFSPIPSVVIVHDLTHRRFYGRAKRTYYDLVYRPLYKRCDTVICVSEFTRQEFLEWSGMPEEKVHLIYNGYESAFSEQGPAHKPGYPYIFYGGNHRAYKNLERLLSAFATSSLPRNGIKLVMTGSASRELGGLVHEKAMDEHVVFSGRLPSEDIPAYYRGALAVAYVSLFEGFGLPIVEAFACGVPVLTSNVSAMPEIAGDGALLVDPENVEEIRAALDKIVSDRDLRDTLIAAGRQRRGDFDWEASAKKLWQTVKAASA